MMSLNEMTLPSGILSSSPGGLKLSVTEAPRNIESETGKNSFASLKLEGQSRARTRDLRLSKQAALTTAPGSPPASINSRYRGIDIHIL